jgi:hypothetical protein
MKAKLNDIKFFTFQAESQKDRDIWVTSIEFFKVNKTKILILIIFF